MLEGQLPCLFLTLYDAVTRLHLVLGQIVSFDIQMVKKKTLGMPQGIMKDMKNNEC